MRGRRLQGPCAEPAASPPAAPRPAHPAALLPTPPGSGNATPALHAVSMREPAARGRSSAAEMWRPEAGGGARGGEKQPRGGVMVPPASTRTVPQVMRECSVLFRYTENCCVFTQLLFCNSRVRILSRSHLIHRSHQPLCGAGCTLCASFIQSFC